VFRNDRLTELFGLTDGRVEGVWPAEFFLDADRPAVERSLDEGEAVVEAWADTTEGRIRLELTGRVLTDDDECVRGFCGIGRDVTERYEREQQVAAQNDRLIGDIVTVCRWLVVTTREDGVKTLFSGRGETRTWTSGRSRRRE
jgi:PAS domain S-box-containing protein